LRLSTPLMVASGILLLLLAGTLGIVVTRWWTRSHARANAGALAWQNVTMRRFATQGGVPFRVALSPDGKSLVYRQRINGRDSLWLGEIDSNSSVRISERTDVFYSAITYAPDGESLYLTVRDPQRDHELLMRMAVTGGVMTELTEDLTGAVTFAPDGKQLAFLRQNSDGKQTSIIITDADGKGDPPPPPT